MLTEMLCYTVVAIQLERKGPKELHTWEFSIADGNAVLHGSYYVCAKHPQCVILSVVELLDKGATRVYPKARANGSQGSRATFVVL